MNPRFLQIAIFITGCAGIVAEYVLSTLATYLLGNGVFQWAMVMSLMLFAMGIGSRLSRYIRFNLFDSFLLAEFVLSILCALSAVVSYSVAAHISQPSTAIIIYIHSMLIGCLIGMEIPLVTRINEQYASLRVNISSIMEKDYFGALVGGVFFVFVALPYLGMTYTPVVLGSINFIVASMLIFGYFKILKRKRIIIVSGVLSLVIIVLIFAFAKPVILFSEQKKYSDKIIYYEQTRYQKIVMTRWKNNVWLYLNGQEQFSTYDEQRYHEPLVHPAMNLSGSRERVLVMGGGDGLAVREILKYKDVKKIDLVDLDEKMTDLAKNHPVLTSINQGSMNSPKLNIHNSDGLSFLENNNEIYNVIIIDFPDPDTMDLMHLYSRHFYKMIKKHLASDGIFVTQASSPFFSPYAFLSIRKTIDASGFISIPYHQHIATMGDWGWVIASGEKRFNNHKNFKKAFRAIDLKDLDSRFINEDILDSMLVFGKDVFSKIDMDRIKINTKTNPVLYQYYTRGRWEIY